MKETGRNVVLSCVSRLAYIDSWNVQYGSNMTLCNISFLLISPSNVVEKCITHSSRPERALLIDEVCSYNDG